MKVQHRFSMMNEVQHEIPNKIQKEEGMRKDAKRDTRTMWLRGVPVPIANKIALAAHQRGWSMGRYIEALVKLHECMQAKAESDEWVNAVDINRMVRKNLNALGLGPVSKEAEKTTEALETLTKDHEAEDACRREGWKV
jgi:hypothetical protein